MIEAQKKYIHFRYFPSSGTCVCQARTCISFRCEQNPQVTGYLIDQFGRQKSSIQINVGCCGNKSDPPPTITLTDLKGGNCDGYTEIKE